MVRFPASAFQSWPVTQSYGLVMRSFWKFVTSSPCPIPRAAPPRRWDTQGTAQSGIHLRHQIHPLHRVSPALILKDCHLKWNYPPGGHCGLHTSLRLAYMDGLSKEQINFTGKQRKSHRRERDGIFLYKYLVILYHSNFLMGNF